MEDLQVDLPLDDSLQYKGLFYEYFLDGFIDSTTWYFLKC